MVHHRLSILVVFAVHLLIQGPNYICAQDRSLTVQSGTALDGKGNLWAVVIGISSYKNLPRDKQLLFAHRDAQEFAEFLRSPNGGGFPSTHIKLLVNQEATLSAMRTALGTWLPRSAESDDIVYIFFAGHGVVEGERDGYLVAHDSDPQNLYATALAVAELDRIITERLRARTVVLIADACHAGNLGWTSRSTGERALIGRYLTEVGKSGRGVFRLLGSRADENSYEDQRWGGGHGVFTHFLLQGLRGKADYDRDGVVRMTEVLEYLSKIVPEETKSLQHPRAAGSVDAQLPLAVLSLDQPPPALAANQTVTLEVRGAPGSEVYLNSTYRGRVRSAGVLLIEGLSAGRYEVSVDPPGAESFKQTVALAMGRTIFNAALPESAAIRSSPLVAQIKQALNQRLVIEAGGAWEHYQRLIRENPREPQRASLEIALSAALEEIGQQAINNYVRLPLAQIKPDLFVRAAVAFGYLQSLRPADEQLEEKRLFCEGRALLLQQRTREAMTRLERAITLNPRAAYAHNALGLAYEMERNNDKALESFRRAAELAPQWSLPRAHLGVIYLQQGKFEQSEREIKAARELDPRNPDPPLLLGNLYLQQGKLEQSVQQLQAAAQLGSRSSDLRYLLAVAYRRQGLAGEAERELVELLRITPNYANAYHELGLLYEAAKQHSKAAESFEAYLRLDPNSALRDEIRARAVKNREQAGRQVPTLKKKL
jgi:tetratricopeptide (TPR) repeat protein/uncharacterized caspase-like protein